MTDKDKLALAARVQAACNTLAREMDDCDVSFIVLAVNERRVSVTRWHGNATTPKTRTMAQEVGAALTAAAELAGSPMTYSDKPPPRGKA